MKTRHLTWTLAIVAAGALVACGGGGEAGSAAPADAAEAPAEAPAPAGQPVDNALMAMTVPADWDIVDDSEKMKMVTLTKKGSGGKVGVYLKVEGSGNWGSTPAEAITSFAESKGGSAAATTTINGIEWVHTTYEAYGTVQTMMVTKKDGNKITATVLGDAYDASPDVQMILDSMVLK
jgi:hypothetical protein